MGSREALRSGGNTYKNPSHARTAAMTSVHRTPIFCMSGRRTEIPIALRALRIALYHGITRDKSQYFSSVRVLNEEVGRAEGGVRVTGEQTYAFPAMTCALCSCITSTKYAPAGPSTKSNYNNQNNPIGISISSIHNQPQIQTHRRTVDGVAITKTRECNKAKEEPCAHPNPIDEQHHQIQHDPRRPAHPSCEHPAQQHRHRNEDQAADDRRSQPIFWYPDSAAEFAVANHGSVGEIAREEGAHCVCGREVWVWRVRSIE